jgi:hypothetical protein
VRTRSGDNPLRSKEPVMMNVPPDVCSSFDFAAGRTRAGPLGGSFRSSHHSKEFGGRSTSTAPRRVVCSGSIPHLTPPPHSLLFPLLYKVPHHTGHSRVKIASLHPPLSARALPFPVPLFSLQWPLRCTLLPHFRPLHRRHRHYPSP